MTAPQPLPPEQNIGPAYMAFGAILLLVFVLIIATLLWPVATSGAMPSDFVVKVLAGLAVMDFVGFLLFILRPARFDQLFRDVVAALPGFKYGTPPATPPGETP